MALMANLLRVYFEQKQPWTRIFKHWVDTNEIEGGRIWDNLPHDQRILSGLPFKLKHAQVFNGLLQTWKELGAWIEWRGCKCGDSLQHQNMWTFRTENGMLMERFPELMRRGIRAGLRTCRDLWDPVHDKWFHPEVIRQRFKLSMDWCEVVRAACGMMDSKWKIRNAKGEETMGVEWGWKNGSTLQDTTVAGLYKLLNGCSNFEVTLNRKWNRTDWKTVWEKRVQIVWRGTQHTNLRLWNWKVMTQSLPVRMKFRRCEKVDTGCCWCKGSQETVLHCLWACPALRSYWNEIKSRLRKGFGNMELSACKVLLGSVWGMPEELVRIWATCTAVFTKEIWLARNQRIFTARHDPPPGRGHALRALIYVGWLLSRWKGKHKVMMRQIGEKLMVTLRE